MNDLSVLDVGCGVRFLGDVNCDLHPEPTGHRAVDQRRLAPALDTKAIPNFVKADAHHLPFRNKSFETVYSRHLIEHLDHPILFLRECVRVAKIKVVVICPHRLARNRKMKVYHKHDFNVKWFQKATARLGLQCDTRINYETPTLLHFITLPLRWPNEIETTIYAGNAHPKPHIAIKQIDMESHLIRERAAWAEI